MTTNPITVWITKYALTRGIFEAEVQRIGAYVTAEHLSEDYFGEDLDWHRTRESAVKRAEEMRDNKIKSLKKQIAKLEGMDFKDDYHQPPRRNCVPK